MSNILRQVGTVLQEKTRTGSSGHLPANPKRWNVHGMRKALVRISFRNTPIFLERILCYCHTKGQLEGGSSCAENFCRLSRDRSISARSTIFLFAFFMEFRAKCDDRSKITRKLGFGYHTHLSVKSHDRRKISRKRKFCDFTEK